ncbi:isoprenylcysteine carboxylmethyltransferase family protein [Bradyrhizobium sp. STM 3843]|uniref:methyltransferase family protein n=1 Tax=Bradyrhizobium sp. STM 3843 TaxID=551947 RepID=UPI0032422BE1
MIVVMAILLFTAAGTLHYWQGWLFLLVYFTASVVITLDLMRRDPALLERRMRGGPFAEKEPAQRLIMAFVSVGFIALVVVPGLDRRFALSHMPPAVVIAGNVLVLLGFAGVFLVFRESSFAAATIEVASDQRVVSSGPYALVRHPMYAAALVMLIGMPVALGSWWGLLLIVAILPLLIWRLLDEERLLEMNLPGYRAYQGRVRYRLVRWIW